MSHGILRGHSQHCAGLWGDGGGWCELNPRAMHHVAA
eukprot:CAMPEP_0175998602 /NCGR_PEP_ID=MMETSP0108-20121206/56834_1 /TAXON_ID=195067 ORGANISM="Goniomonas pacifica, Strain CCMP1869" /NCGR_SAMPLE_ID=MMETSP0108 /ASSEMBLY_ACC=CAM_ASM_000204 /LENGTH=36 /DNA_ID= /DNA_START= /DNA_END= /DNA_ORIENTATION=